VLQRTLTPNALHFAFFGYILGTSVEPPSSASSTRVIRGQIEAFRGFRMMCGENQGLPGVSYVRQLVSLNSIRVVSMLL
jgi:hypothetical protein